MAFTKKQKQEMLKQYEEWLSNSQAVFMVQYNKMGVKRVEDLRSKARDVGGEAHVVKNTLFKMALENQGLAFEGDLTLTTLAGFAFEDSPGLAKALTEASKDDPDKFKFKKGYLNGQEIDVSKIKELAELPPLPVMRAQLLGLIQTPAGQVVRTIAEPARGLAAVIKAKFDEGGEAEEAAAA